MRKRRKSIRMYDDRMRVWMAMRYICWATATTILTLSRLTFSNMGFVFFLIRWLGKTFRAAAAPPKHSKVQNVIYITFLSDYISTIFPSTATKNVCSPERKRNSDEANSSELMFLGFLFLNGNANVHCFISIFGGNFQLSSHSIELLVLLCVLRSIRFLHTCKSHLRLMFGSNDGSTIPLYHTVPWPFAWDIQRLFVIDFGFLHFYYRRCLPKLSTTILLKVQMNWRLKGAIYWQLLNRIRTAWRAGGCARSEADR